MRSTVGGISQVVFGMCVVALFGTSTVNAADAWPSRPIRIVVGFAPGGPMDSVVRALAPGLSRELGQSVIVDNRPGAGAAIGASTVAKAAPDGYTLLGGHSAAVSATAQIRKVDYDPRVDLTPVAGASANYTILVARKDLPANNLAELKTHARNSPKGVTCATAGMGSGSHVACEAFAETLGIKILPIHYKGSAPAAVDLIGGQVDIFFDPSSLPHVKSGKVKAIATRGKGDARMEELPGVETFIEQGYPSVSDKIWFGLLAPAGTPENIVQRLAEAVKKIVHEPETVAALASISQFPDYLGPAELKARINEDWEHYGRVIEKHGLRNPQ